jgi:hypothetical protein
MRSMKKSNWLIVGIVVVLLLFLLFGGGMMFGGWGYHGWGMMGSYGGPGIMGWRYSPFGWIGMVFMWLVPLGFLALVVFGIAWLAKSLGNPAPQIHQSACPNCGKGVQADWQNCPYCGTVLK